MLLPDVSHCWRVSIHSIKCLPSIMHLLSF